MFFRLEYLNAYIFVTKMMYIYFNNTYNNTYLYIYFNNIYI